jgi:hypothetical protein
MLAEDRLALAGGEGDAPNPLRWERENAARFDARARRIGRPAAGDRNEAEHTHHQACRQGANRAS